LIGHDAPRATYSQTFWSYLRSGKPRILADFQPLASPDAALPSAEIGCQNYVGSGYRILFIGNQFPLSIEA
jgi:hypothetical protein